MPRRRQRSTRCAIFSIPPSICRLPGSSRSIFFFFFQAEDGIRYSSVTGVQTCALPIYLRGASVTVLDIDAAEAREAAERIGPRAIGLATDVTDHSAVMQSVAEVVERRGHIVGTSSVYAFVNGMLNSPYAVAKSGVESLGRSLRAELTPLGASASVAYFGWVDTKMVQDAVAANGDRMQQNLPEFLRKRITPDQAGAAVVRGIEERAPRIF